MTQSYMTLGNSKTASKRPRVIFGGTKKKKAEPTIPLSEEERSVALDLLSRIVVGMPTRKESMSGTYSKEGIRAVDKQLNWEKKHKDDIAKYQDLRTRDKILNPESHLPSIESRRPEGGNDGQAREAPKYDAVHATEASTKAA